MDCQSRRASWHFWCSWVINKKAISPKRRLSSKVIYFMVWVLPRFTPQLLPSSHPNPSHFTTANWGPLGKISTSFFCNVIEAMNKTSSLHEYLFPWLLQSRNTFWHSPWSLHFEKPLLYTAKEHRSSVKGLAASYIKVNSTNRLQRQSNFSFLYFSSMKPRAQGV